MGEPGRRLLGDRYRLDGLIATGGMGQVWRARDTLLSRPVAVKVLRSEYTADPTFLARFRAEAVHAASLSHPNIAAVYDYGEVAADEDGEHVAYLVMELVDGEPLSARLREGALGTETTLSVLRQAAAALGEAHHAGLVHRDVKPGNILVRPDGRVKITDFGIAWSAGSVPLTQAGQVLGTPQYVAPEQVYGQPPSPASDVYSLGLVGYECLTGHAAYRGDNPLTIALKHVQEQPAPLPAQLPTAVRQLMDAAVARDPRKRPSDGDAFMAAIDRVQLGRAAAEVPATVPVIPLRGVPVDPPTTAVRRPPVDPHRVPWVPAVVAAAVTIAVGLAVGILLLGRLGDPGTATAATQRTQEQTAQASAPVVLDGADYLGRSAEDVARNLSDLGLTVQQRREVTPGAAPGTVIGVDPVGRELTAGDLVLLTVAVAAPSAPATTSDPATVAVERADRTTPRRVPSSSEPAPVTAAPESTAPATTTAAPETSSAPETSAPETSTSDTSTPETSTPETSTSDTSTPDTSSAPDTSAPETSRSTSSDPSDSTSPEEPSDGSEPPGSSEPSDSDGDTEPPDSSAPGSGTGSGG